MDEEDILVIKEEPEEISQSETSENELTNHIPPMKNGRLSPKSPPIGSKSSPSEETDSDIANQTNKFSAKKEQNLNIWASNIRLRHQVCRELKKPGRSKLLFGIFVQEFLFYLLAGLSADFWKRGCEFKEFYKRGVRILRNSVFWGQN